MIKIENRLLDVIKQINKKLEEEDTKIIIEEDYYPTNIYYKKLIILKERVYDVIDFIRNDRK